MALTAGDCLYPRWRLKAEVFWPAHSMAQCTKQAKAALDGGLIEQATDKATADGFEGDAIDTAARWYVGYLAADGRLQQMGGLPGSVDVRDEGSSEYAPDQRLMMAGLRDDMLAEYTALVDGLAAAPAFVPPRSSRTSRACFEII